MENLTEPAAVADFPDPDDQEAVHLAAEVASGNRRGGRLGPILVILGCALYFLLPLLAMARFSLQNVPTVRLGWSTLFEKWTTKFLTQAFDEPGFSDALNLSLQLALGTVIVTLALLLPTTLWLHLRVPKAR